MDAEDKLENIDWQKIHEAVRDIRRAEADMASSQGAHMKFCREKRDEIKKALKRVGAAGGNPEAIKFNLKLEDLENAVADHKADADAETKESADIVRQKLGVLADTPLGGATIIRAETDDAKALNKKRGKKAEKTEVDTTAAKKGNVLEFGQKLKKLSAEEIAKDQAGSPDNVDGDKTQH